MTEIYDFQHMDQPANCLFFDGACRYPIDDCQNCPVIPENYNPFLWGMSKANIE